MASLCPTWIAIWCAIQTANAGMRLENVQACFSRLGPERTSEVYYPPLDNVCYRFDVVGGRRTLSGVSIQYSMTLLNHKGEIVAATSAGKEQLPPLGGDRFMGYCSCPLTDDLPAGPYKVVLTVADNNSSEIIKYQRNIQLKARELAVVGVSVSRDDANVYPISTIIPLGQRFHCQLIASGLMPRDGWLLLGARLEILDADGHLCSAADLPPQHAPANDGAVRVWWTCDAVNRPGDFILRNHLTDVTAKKSIIYDLPVHVVRP